MKVGAVKQSSRDNSEEEMIKENKQVAVAVSHVQKSAFGVTHNFLLILENNGLQTELKISGLCKRLVSIYLQLFLIFSKPDRQEIGSLPVAWRLCSVNVFPVCNILIFRCSIFV